MPPRNHDFAETYSIANKITSPWIKGAVIASLPLDAPGEYFIQVFTYQNDHVLTTGDLMFGLHADSKALIDKLPGCFELTSVAKGFIHGPFDAKALIQDVSTPITVIANELENASGAIVYAYIAATRMPMER